MSNYHATLTPLLAIESQTRSVARNALKMPYAEITQISKECRKKAAQNIKKFEGAQLPKFSTCHDHFTLGLESPAGGMEVVGKLREHPLKFSLNN